MSFLQEYRNRPRRVVFYGRVSTEHEAQVSALDNRMDWYQELAAKNPNWEVVGRYVAGHQASVLHADDPGCGARQV